MTAMPTDDFRSGWGPPLLTKKKAHGACRRGASSEPRYVTLTRVPLSRGSAEASPTPPVRHESQVARLSINRGGEVQEGSNWDSPENRRVISP